MRGFLAETMMPSRQQSSLLDGCLHRTGALQTGSLHGGGHAGAHLGSHAGAHFGSHLGSHLGSYLGSHTGAHFGWHTGAHTGSQGVGHAGWRLVGIQVGMRGRMTYHSYCRNSICQRNQSIAAQTLLGKATRLTFLVVFSSMTPYVVFLRFSNSKLFFSQSVTMGVLEIFVNPLSLKSQLTA